MRIGDLIEWERAIDMRPNPTFRDTAHDFARPAGNLFAFAPHVTEVQAEHALVAIHQGERMKPRSLGQCFYCSQLSQDARGGSSRHPKDSHPSRVPQTAIALLPTLTAERIDNQFYAAAFR